MNDFTIFKIEYDWYEGEHNEVLIGKKVSLEEFEKDLVEAKSFAESLKGKEVEGAYLGKGYSVECLPQFYEQIIWYLTDKLGYLCCDYYKDITYTIDDENNGEDIVIRKSENKIEHKEIRDVKEKFNKLTKLGEEFARKRGIKDEEDVIKIIKKGRGIN